MNTPKKRGLTMVELLVVLLIIGILSSISVNVYIGHIERARYAAARATIAELETAISAYQIDTGQLPPSGSGTSLAPNPIDNRTFLLAANGYADVGCGYLFVALTRSLNGNMFSPIDPNWHGPYMNFPVGRIGNTAGNKITTETLPEYQILDPWGQPYIYVSSADYTSLADNFFGATPLSATSPLFGTETFFNANWCQIVSKGFDRQTGASPMRGLSPGDETNFRQ